MIILEKNQIFDQKVEKNIRQNMIFGMMTKIPQGFIAKLIKIDQNCYKSLGNFDHHAKNHNFSKGKINLLGSKIQNSS